MARVIVTPDEETDVVLLDERVYPVHLENKLAAIDALAQYRLASKDAKRLEQWAHLNNRIKRKSRIRNKVAH